MLQITGLDKMFLFCTVFDGVYPVMSVESTQDDDGLRLNGYNNGLARYGL
jgi:hypothetical protein